MFGVSILFHAPDELGYIALAGVKSDDIVVVLQLAHFNAVAGGRIPRVLIVKNHGLTHDGFDFGDGVEAIDYVVIAILGIIAVIAQQTVGEIRGIGQNFFHRWFDRAEFSARPLLVAEDVEQDAKDRKSV